MFKKTIIFLFFCFIFVSCKAKKIDVNKTASEIKLHESASNLHVKLTQISEEKQLAFNEYINGISLQEKICQLFIVNLVGNDTFSPVEKMNAICPSDDSWIVPGGFLFFGYNLSDTEQGVISFTDSIYKYSKNNNKIPPFLSADQEGGKVNRLRNLSGTLPSPKDVSTYYTKEEASLLFNLQAIQMNRLGFNLNLAPVVEVSTVSNQDFLGDRSFGSFEQVVSYSGSFIKSFENNRVGTVLKHFPGNSNTDPHIGLPVITLDKEELMESLESFRQLIKYNPSGILMSHAITTQIDNGKPACLSKIWVTDILRNQFNYKGIIFSDDIFMGALADNNYPPEIAVVMAVEAGIDCIMVSEKRIASAAKVLYEKALEDSGFEQKLTESLKRIIQFKLKTGILEYKKNSENEYSIVAGKQGFADNRIEAFISAKNKNLKLTESK